MKHFVLNDVYYCRILLVLQHYISIMDTIQPFNNLPIDSLFRYEIEEIEMAYRIADILHKDAKDIKAGGNEIELTIRRFFEKKLTSKYYVTNGHIIDSSTKISPQFDVVIADNSKSPILYKSKDDTNILIYESIYSIGEVKKTWYKDGKGFPLENFTRTIKRLKKELNREPVSPKFVDIGGAGATMSEPTTRNKYKNPLFNFLFVVSSDAFEPHKHEKTFNSFSMWADIPNVTVLLDLGVIVNIDRKARKEGKISINLYPEFVDKKEDAEWVLIPFDEKHHALAYFYLILLEHLNNCVLKIPNLIGYLNKMFELSLSEIINLSSHDRNT